jgi:hypothetical protein
MTDDFEKRFYDHIEEMREFRGEIRHYMKEQPGRCSNHSARISELDDRAVDIEQAIGFRKGDENTIHERVKIVEKFRGYVVFTLEALAWLAGAGTLIYAGVSLFLHSAAQNSDIVARMVSK